MGGCAISLADKYGRRGSLLRSPVIFGLRQSHRSARLPDEKNSTSDHAHRPRATKKSELKNPSTKRLEIVRQPTLGFLNKGLDLERRS
jgi:hypothetical protein